MEEEEKEEATDIKSNNPHLAGGEKIKIMENLSKTIKKSNPNYLKIKKIMKNKII